MLRKQILLLGKQKMFLVGVKNIFASRTQILRLKHMFPSLATPGKITRNIVSATMLPSLARPLEVGLSQCRPCGAKFSFRIVSLGGQFTKYGWISNDLPATCSCDGCTAFFFCPRSFFCGEADQSIKYKNYSLA